MSQRVPFPALPEGWFQVAHVLDAYCPHEGADIGVGGTVDVAHDGERVDARYTFLVPRDDTGEMSRLGVGTMKDFLNRRWAEQSYPEPATAGI